MTNRKPLTGTKAKTYDTVCTNGMCPFTACSHHLQRAKSIPAGSVVTVAGLDAVCRRYIDWLIDQIAGR